jgi:hypothetical protein
MDARRSFYLYSKQNDFAERPAPLGQADPVDISHFPPANDNEPASVRLLVRGWMVLLNRLIARITPFFELIDDISDDYVAFILASKGLLFCLSRRLDQRTRYTTLRPPKIRVSCSRGTGPTVTEPGHTDSAVALDSFSRPAARGSVAGEKWTHQRVRKRNCKDFQPI